MNMSENAYIVKSHAECALTELTLNNEVRFMLPQTNGSGDF